MSTSPRQRLLLGALAALGLAALTAVVLRRRDTGIPQAHPDTLPWQCRLARHGWITPKPGQLPARRTCHRCESLEL